MKKLILTIGFLILSGPAFAQNGGVIGATGGLPDITTDADCGDGVITGCVIHKDAKGRVTGSSTYPLTNGGTMTQLNAGKNIALSPGVQGGSCTTVCSAALIAPVLVATGDHTFTNAEFQGLAIMNSASAHQFTIPQATATGNFAAGDVVTIMNGNTGCLSLASVTSTILPAPPTCIAPWQATSLASDGQNYRLVGLSLGGIAPGSILMNNTATNPNWPVAVDVPNCHSSGNALQMNRDVSPYVISCVTNSAGSGAYDLVSGALVTEIANEGTTGTTVNKLAGLTGAPSTVKLITTSATTFRGIVTAGAGTTGNAQIAVEGQATCVFDGATTAGDYVVPSSTVAGDCHDTGATTYPAQQTVGRVLSTNGSAGSYSVLVMSPSAGASAGGGSGGGETPAYVAGNWYLPERGILTSGGAMTAGTIYARPFYLAKAITISDLAARVTTVGSSNSQLAIYASNANGTRPTGNKLCSTTDLVNTSGGTINGACASGALSPGIYWMEINSSDSSVAMQIFSSSNSNMAWLAGSSSLANVSGSSNTTLDYIKASQTYGTWPDETSTSWTEGVNSSTWAMLYFKVASVP